MTEYELDLLCAELTDQIKSLEAKNKMLEEECNAMRNQIRELERQVYNGSTM